MRRYSGPACSGRGLACAASTLTRVNTGCSDAARRKRRFEPAIRSVRLSGIDVEGPASGRYAVLPGAARRFRPVVAMYHDQGHGPVKVMGIEEGVNVTVGLPVARISVDHGTAFDIAGTGKGGRAQHAASGLNQAIILCARRL